MLPRLILSLAQPDPSATLAKLRETPAYQAALPGAQPGEGWPLTGPRPTSATPLLPVCALRFLGGEAVRGFAFTFLIGLIAGTYSSVFVASPLLIMLRQRALVRKEEAASA